MYLLATSGATVTNNRIAQAGGTALALAGGNTTVQVKNNDFTGSLRGVSIRNDGGVSDNTTIAVNENSFNGNTGYGLNADTGYTGALNAETNYWGASSGPTNAGNPGGAGVIVSGPGRRFHAVSDARH